MNTNTNFKLLKTRLDYYDGSDVLSGHIRISPSSLENYFTRTSEWFAQTLDGRKDFLGNEATVKGTIAHFIVECYVKGNTNAESMMKEVDRYISKMAAILEIELPSSVLSHGIIMGNTLVNYLKNNNAAFKGATAEEFIYSTIAGNVSVGGSVDLTVASQRVLYDYKTTSSKTPPKVFSKRYLLQQLAYAHISISNGVPIDRLVILCVNTPDVNRISEKTGKPLKDYPSVVTKLVHEITPEDLTMIKNVLELVADSITAAQLYPDIKHVITQTFKTPPKPNFNVPSDF